MSTENVDNNSGEQNNNTEITAQDVAALLGGGEEQAVVKEEVAEVKKPEVKEEKQPEVDKFAAKFAALSRQEKALKAQQKALAAREAALAEKEKAPAAPKVEAQEPLELRLKKDTFGTLKELGLTPETLVQMMLNDGKPTQELQMQLLKDEVSRSAKTELEKLQEKLALLEQKEADREKQKEESQQAELINGFKTQIKEFVSADLEKFDLINVEEDYGIELVYDMIARDAQAKQEELGDEFTGDEIMSIEEAAQKVEEQLLEAAKKRIERSKKLKATQAPTSQPNAPGKKASATLSNSASQVQSQTRAPMSDEERIAAAAAMLKKQG